ncbi:MAG: hypothetical protein RBJ76_08140 [Stenomitos frigidus ULC029]
MNCLQKRHLQKQQGVEPQEQVIAVSDRVMVVTTDLLPAVNGASVLIRLPMGLVGLLEMLFLAWGRGMYGEG